MLCHFQAPTKPRGGLHSPLDAFAHEVLGGSGTVSAAPQPHAQSAQPPLPKRLPVLKHFTVFDPLPSDIAVPMYGIFPLHPPCARVADPLCRTSDAIAGALFAQVRGCHCTQRTSWTREFVSWDMPSVTGQVLHRGSGACCVDALCGCQHATCVSNAPVSCVPPPPSCVCA